MSALPSTPQPPRAIGRWSMLALALNGIIGSGIFGLPALLAGFLGRWSPLDVLLAGVATAVIVACHAEVASQFSASGGTYLYVRTAFGRLAGLETAWLMLLSRIAACAGSANLLVAYLVEFWPAAERPLMHVCMVSAVLGTLVLINLVGVRVSVRLGDLAIVGKLGALALVVVVGAPHFMHPIVLEPLTPGAGRWLDATLLLFFAYGGFEAALNPMGEARDPRRDAPFALLMALGVVMLFYAALQAVVITVLPDAAHSVRPLADVVRIAMGETGAKIVTAGVLVSVLGFLNANLLAMPRLIYALACRSDFPAVFARLHPKWRTPYVAIAVFAMAVFGCTLLGSFSWNATLSAVARLAYYAAICAAVPLLRRRQPEAASFRIPAGSWVALLGVSICVLLATRVDFSNALILVLTGALALANWAVLRRRPGAATRA